MNIELNHDNLLSLIELQKTDKNLAQVDKVISNTKGFDKIVKHVVTLNDFLHHHHGFVTLSSSHDSIKIKCDTQEAGSDIVKEFNEKVVDWADKYKVEIEKVPEKEVYYILGAKE